jgi:hypothetical protein
VAVGCHKRSFAKRRLHIIPPFNSRIVGDVDQKTVDILRELRLERRFILPKYQFRKRATERLSDVLAHMPFPLRIRNESRFIDEIPVFPFIHKIKDN